ncbi:MAG: hypothetical protein RJQ14_16195, partial [Marinoscillum sp.]
MNYTSINITCFLREGTRALRVQLIKGWFVALITLAASCGKGIEQQTIAETYVLKGDLKLHPTEGKWYYNNEPYNGFGIAYHENDSMAEKIGFCNGKKEGIAQKWFDNGSLGSEIFYAANKINGSKKTWWPNGKLSSEAFFDMGTVVGIQKTWYVNGQLARLTTVKDGKPEGLQQAWLKNGKIYANYE